MIKKSDILAQKSKAQQVIIDMKENKELSLDELITKAKEEKKSLIGMGIGLVVGSILG